MKIACPICRHVESKIAARENLSLKYKIFYCGNCKAEFSWPMKSFFNYGDLESKSEFKNTVVESLRREFIHSFAVTFLDIIKKKSILDIGAGSGVFLNYARKLGFDTYGIEASDSLVKLLNENCPFVNACSSKEEAFDLPEFWPQKYDVISALDVLEHLEDPLAACKNFYDHLKNDGYFIFTVPNRDRYYYKTAKIINDFVPFKEGGDNPPYHLTFWRSKTIKIFMENIGFKNYCILKGGLLWRKNLLIKNKYSPLLSGFISILYKNSSKIPLPAIKFLENYGTHLLVFAKKGNGDLAGFKKNILERLYKKDIPFFKEVEII